MVGFRVSGSVSTAAVRYRDYYGRGREMQGLTVPQPKTADGPNSPTGFGEGRMLCDHSFHTLTYMLFPV